jgi:protease I
LAGKRIALLVGPLYEDIEVHYPLLRLQDEGAEVITVGFEETAYRGVFWSAALGGRGRWSVPGIEGRVYVGIHGMPVLAEAIAEEVDPAALDGIFIPGGYAADHLRRSPAIISLCQSVAAKGRPVAAICHGPWVLISAGLLPGRRATSHWVIRPEVEGAGATWVDQACVVDGPVITSRMPGDLGLLCRALTNCILEAEQAEAREPDAAIDGEPDGP